MTLEGTHDPIVSRVVVSRLGVSPAMSLDLYLQQMVHQDELVI